MKKFKGGLYADLGNYKTSLPNTEILNNFFASNPVGYRSGGMVRGVAGGNPTGMQVTGGFLSNAQRYASGSKDAVSAYYSPSKVGVRPGNFRAQGNQRRLDVKKQIADKYFGGKLDAVNDFIKNSMDATDPFGVEFGGSEKLINQFSEELEIPVEDIKEAVMPISESIDTYKGKKGYTGQKGTSLKEDPDRPSTIEIDKYSPTGLEEREKYGDNIADNTKIMSKKIPVPEKPFVSQNPDYVKGMLSQGIRGVGDFDIDQFNKMKKESEMKENQIDLDEIESLNENEQNIIKSSKKSGKSNVVDTINNEVGSDDPYSETKDTIKDLQENIKKVASGKMEVSDKDSNELNKLIKNMYGDKKDKDAPAWAMPLMIAGLNMAASDNPDMLGAMAEGGIKGMEQYAKQIKDKKDDMKDQLATYLKVEDINIRKDQMKQTSDQFYAGLETNTNLTIAQLEATITKGNLDRKMAYEEMYQKWEVHESDLLYKYDALDWSKTSETMKIKHNAKLANAQILKLHAESEALGLKKPTYDTFNIDGEDVRVAIHQKNDGTYDITEIGQPSSASTVLKAFMDTFGTTITEQIMDGDGFDSNKWSQMYQEFKKMVNSEEVGTLKDPNA